MKRKGNLKSRKGRLPIRLVRSGRPDNGLVWIPVVGLLMVLGVGWWLLGLQDDVADSALQELNASGQVSVAFAGYAKPGASVGNQEGFKHGQIVNYSLPSGIVQGQLVLAGLWKSSPKALIHQGDEQGVVFFGFSGSSVDIIASHGETKADAWVFFDGGFASQEVWGTNVEIVNGRPTVQISKAGAYNVLKGVSQGPHLMGMATNASGLSVYAVVIKP